MHVVATAGHVDHGKSTLVRALTGMEPDRLDEERRRGLTIELGYAWTELPSGETLAFVDVPGHERFLGTMLAGVGPVPAVMFVVAADEGWMPQSEEHLVALEALGVRHCLLVVTRCDLADPAPAIEQSRARLNTALATPAVATPTVGHSASSAPVHAASGEPGGRSDLAPAALGHTTSGEPGGRPDRAPVASGHAASGEPGGADPVSGEPGGRASGAGDGGGSRPGEAVGGVVAVSGRTGRGLAELRRALDRLVAGLPRPDPGAEVRLWIDRAFSVTGSGTVVTGTLPAGTVSVGDELLLDGRPVRVRGLESLKRGRDTVSGVARVAVNLRGQDLPDRGRALVSPGGWTYTDTVDVHVTPVGPLKQEPTGLPRRLTVHVGSAAVTAEARTLGGPFVRLRLAHPLPLHLGDILLLRDPGRAAGHDRSEVRVLAGATILDVRPPTLHRRGAARERATHLSSALPPPTTSTSGLSVTRSAGGSGGFDVGFALRLHRLLRGSDLRAMGVVAHAAGVAGEWYADPGYWEELRGRLAEVVRRYADGHPLEPAMPVEAARHELGLPDRRLVAALVGPPLTLAGGRIAARPAGLPEPVARAVERVRRELAARPFQAPEAGRLAELGLGPKELAAAVRAGTLLRVGEGIVLLPGADARAAESLRRLPQPFTVSQARRALDTTRRVAVPLLEHLDRAGLTERLDEARRRCR